jgi:multiple sugar transport system permease protein
MVMLFLASLQRVPTELYESAKIDGANWRQRTFRITLPQITPIIFFNLIISLIGLFQYFLVPYIFGKGDGSPEGKTMFLGVLFFREAFHYNQLGRGSAIAWVIFGIALIVTIILFKTQKSWVYYSSEK